MDARHAEHLKTGARVAVYMGPHEILGTPPIVTTGTVTAVEGVGPDESAAFDGRCWIDIDIAQGQTLPQLYKVAEILGFLLPMAIVEHHEDGSVTGTFPPGTVAP